MRWPDPRGGRLLPPVRAHYDDPAGRLNPVDGSLLGMAVAGIAADRRARATGEAMNREPPVYPANPAPWVEGERVRVGVTHQIVYTGRGEFRPGNVLRREVPQRNPGHWGPRVDGGVAAARMIRCSGGTIHTEECKKQWDLPRWVPMSFAFFSANDLPVHVATLQLLVSGCCIEWEIMMTPEHATPIAWGREIWWRVPPAGKKAAWELPGYIAKPIFQFLMAARLRWGWPCELIHMVVEWVVNTQWFKTNRGLGARIPYRFITSEPPAAAAEKGN